MTADSWVAVRDGLFAVEGDRVVLLVGRCRSCDGVHFPCPELCSRCGGDDVVEQSAGADGARLWGFTVVQVAPPGYRGPVPYGFGVVELSEGIRVVSRITETRQARLDRGLSGRFVLDPLHEDDEGRRVMTYAFEPTGVARDQTDVSGQDQAREPVA